MLPITTKRSSSTSSSRLPRLDRRNAAKNINYDATCSDDSLTLRSTRSLDLTAEYFSQTSFRIEGHDGEVDQLYRNLGLSGPDDFAIPAAAWAARKALSLDPAQPLQSPDRLIPNEQNDLRPPMKSSGEINDDGIKTAKLIPAPPPVMRLIVSEKMGSTWDLARSFAPEGELHEDGVAERSLFDWEEKGMERGAMEMRLGETIGDLTGSCLLSTSNGDSLSTSNGDSLSTLNGDYALSTTTAMMFIVSPNGRFKRNITSWMRGQLLGSGSFGTVFEGISDDGFFFAVKEVSLLDQGSNAKQCILQLEQEIALLSQFEHDNIVQYVGTDKEEAKLFIFLELVTQGSLASLYQKYHLQDSQVSAYTRQILNGLDYLHERNVVHRDIKCANILVDVSGAVKLADFGLAKEITKLNVLKSCKGSVYWMAPEVVNPKRAYGPAADIWSLGCTVLEMLTRQLPYPNLEWTHVFFKIGRGEQPPIPNTLSSDARDFIQKCVQVSPDDRPSASQLLEHPFVKRSMSASTSPDNSFRSLNKYG
ncbi:hypothetical protein J5N97_019578 [Dioscorea zingiberensis]|uniref:mitogen-activated protein kinase kinase kinase n=1 Tax=Dioscorea zingiberensis TaxID=325984 RepID=A0A9D5CEV3_9LILI|nr:hypothetical protein J5N97_019578 [Dioscorea zingiberensis]